MVVRQSTLLKADEVKEIASLVSKYKALGIASLQKVRAAQLQQLKKKLEKSANFRVIKNSLIKRAVSEVKDKEGLENLEEYLIGPNIFLFTDLNPFKLALRLQRSRVMTTARAGDLAALDVTVHAGNTGLPPGPIISQFTAVGLRTRIEAGSVWVAKDTVVTKKGDVISAQLASLLSKLGIKSVEVGLSLRVVYDDGMILTEEELKLDLDEFRRSVEEAYNVAFNLSLKAAYPLSENILFLLRMGQQEAYGLAINADILTPDTIADLVRKAHTEMLSLKARLDELEEKSESESSVQKG
jgi:large subunit ribosomal protein L10